MYSTNEAYSDASKEDFIADGFKPVIAGSSPLPSLTIIEVGLDECPANNDSRGQTSY